MLAAEALRGIGRREVLAAVLLGVIMTAADALGFHWRYLTDTRRESPAVVLACTVAFNQVHAFVLMAAVVIADRAVELGAPMRRSYAVAAIGGCLLGVLLSGPLFRLCVEHAHSPQDSEWLQATFLTVAIVRLTYWLPIGGGLVFFYIDRRAARRTEARLHAAQLDRVRRSKEALESRLQAMQARVEPQLLFNTLAQVERLYGIDPALAGRMLDDLIAYLRAAMPLMRGTSSTVAQEVELARAYLDIARQRPGDRLRVSIDVPPDAAIARMPPMILLPLIDHAVARALEPPSARGEIRILADVKGGRLRLSVVDSGGGLVPETESEAIAAIHQRLDALYGPEGRLVLRRRPSDHATEAVLDIPLEPGSPTAEVVAAP